MSYLDSLNKEVKEYFKILSPEFPEWLEEYINTPEMQRIGKISIACGCDYSAYYGTEYFYSNLEHSVGVALIVWHFSHNKKQTLAGLFHDIATPVFKHCIDFMNGDAEHQESTEERTHQMIVGSKEIMKLLSRDGILPEEVSDYHIYPIADNDMPKFSADRIEYSFSTGLVEKRVWSLEKIKKCYDDLALTINEEGITEVAFKTKEICEEYIQTISGLWPLWTDEKNKAFMQFLADICKSMCKKDYLKIDDFYILSEREVIDKILNESDDYLSGAMKKFIAGGKVIISDTPISGRYCIKMKGKKRYIIPLVITPDGAKRICDISENSKNIIENFKDKQFDKYGCLDLDFKPY